MLRRRSLHVLIALAGAFAFICALAQLFTLRFESGDVYPPYSSLRADPLGTKIFLESVRSLSALSVRVNEKPITRIGTNGAATLFYLGTKETVWTEDELRALEAFANDGGRVVISFFPLTAAPDPDDHEPTATPAPSVTPTPSPMRKHLNIAALGKRWKFVDDFDDDLMGEVVNAQPDLPIEPHISWHSGRYFKPTDGSWRVVYAGGDSPVIIEKTLGRGTIVLASDSYFVSNEAMTAERSPHLLDWLIGSNTAVVFDESHHGIIEQPGVAGLMRKYRLHGFIFGALVVAALFIWKSAARFAPASSTEGDEQVVAGKQSFAGFVNLLRRSIAPKDLLRTSVEEWKKTERCTPSRAEAIESSLATEQSGTGDAALLRSYTEISRMIADKKWKTTAPT
jgi:hypothetical protein